VAIYVPSPTDRTLEAITSVISEFNKAKLARELSTENAKLRREEMASNERMQGRQIDAGAMNSILNYMGQSQATNAQLMGTGLQAGTSIVNTAGTNAANVQVAQTQAGADIAVAKEGTRQAEIAAEPDKMQVQEMINENERNWTLRNDLINEIKKKKQDVAAKYDAADANVVTTRAGLKGTSGLQLTPEAETALGQIEQMSAADVSQVKALMLKATKEIESRGGGEDWSWADFFNGAGIVASGVAGVVTAKVGGLLLFGPIAAGLVANQARMGNNAKAAREQARAVLAYVSAVESRNSILEEETKADEKLYDLVSGVQTAATVTGGR